MIKKLKSYLLFGSIISSLVLLYNQSVKATALDKSEIELSWLSQATIIRETQTLMEVGIDYTITERWNGGYLVKVEISNGSRIAEEWSGSIHLPHGHRIRQNYGVLISDDRADTVNFVGDSWNKRLEEGEKTTAVLVIDGDSSGEIELGFDDYIASLGTPTISSFTDEERQEWKQATANNGTETGNEIDEGETFNEETSNGTETDDGSASEINEVAIENPDTDTSVTDADSTADNGTETGNEIDEGETFNEETLNGTETDDGSVSEINEVAIENPDADSIEYENFGSAGQGGNFDYALALQQNWLFFMANRSGAMGNDNLVEWREDSTLNDGADVGRDLEGGYFDAGDHIKFTQPMAYSTTQLAWSGVDYREAYQQAGQLDELLNAVKWGTDYFLKCHEMSGGKTTKLWVQVGDHTDHYHWVPPEEIANRTARPSFAIDANNPGTDVAAGVASAFATASILFRGVDDVYADKLLNNAIALYEFAENHLGKYSDSVWAANPFYTSWSGYEDELPLGAIWLYRATGDEVYLTKAEDYFKNGVGHIGTYTYATDDHSYAALPLLAKESSDPFFRQEFEDWVGYWINKETGVNYSPGGMAIRSEWASAPLAMSASYLAEWYSDFVEPNEEYSRFAQSQLDYILGNNPRNFSYVVGFGDTYPIRSHHRGSAGSVSMEDTSSPNDNLLVGALVGGPMHDDYSHNDRRDDWVSNEVGTSYNAPLAAAAIQQYDNYGGNTSDFAVESSLPTSDEIDEEGKSENTEINNETNPGDDSNVGREEVPSQPQNLYLSSGTAIAQFENHASGNVYLQDARIIDKVLTRTGVRFTKVQEIDIAYFNAFHGGNSDAWLPSKDVKAYFGDFTISSDSSDVGF